MSREEKQQQKSKLTVKIKPISKLTIYDAAKLEKLTISDNSHMWAILNWVESRHFMRSYGVRLTDIKGYVAIGYLGKEIVGWCVVHYRTNSTTTMSTSIYVDAIHRKNGYGKTLFTQLVNHVKTKDGKPDLVIRHYAFDKAGNGFFKSCSLPERSLI